MNRICSKIKLNAHNKLKWFRKITNIMINQSIVIGFGPTPPPPPKKTHTHATAIRRFRAVPSQCQIRHKILCRGAMRYIWNLCVFGALSCIIILSCRHVCGTHSKKNAYIQWTASQWCCIWEFIKTIIHIYNTIKKNRIIYKTIDSRIASVVLDIILNRDSANGVVHKPHIIIICLSKIKNSIFSNLSLMFHPRNAY